MPLADHYHPPLSERRSWQGFYCYWAAAIGESLNRGVLPPEYFADIRIRVGGGMESDVAALRERPDDSGSRGGTSVLTKPAWAPPIAAMVMPTVFPDDIEVRVFSTSAGPTLAAAIELASPGNKDRPEARRAFAAKCAAYLTRGVGLIIVDIVTNRTANLHDELVELLGRGAAFRLPPETATYAVAYRPSRPASGDQIEVWPEPLAVGRALPILPLALRNSETVPVDLETTYTDARRRARLA